MTKRCLFVILIIAASAISSLAQRDSLKNDLFNSFRKFEVTRLGARRAAANRSVSVAYDGKSYTLYLTPRDLRAAAYFAEDTSAVGVRRLEREPVNTYKGRVAGDEKSQVRLTLDDGNVVGYFQAGGERFFVEQASRFSKNAAADEVVVYRLEDVRRDFAINCPLDLAGELDAAKDHVESQPKTATAGGQKVIELATDADYQYVTTFAANNPSSPSANNHILSLLNMVEGYYESQISITLSIVYQHTWSTADPYTGATRDQLLTSFQTYWEQNYPRTTYKRDAAHLYTFKPQAKNGGWAYLGVMCRNAAFAYALTGAVEMDWHWDAMDSMIGAHEIGHNIGATHSDGYGGCTSTMMNAVLDGSTQPTFCTTSRTEISTYLAVDANSACLIPKGRSPFDFDGDGKTDIAIFRPADGTWWINESSTQRVVATTFGTGVDKLTTGDFTGDGKADVAVFHPSNGSWFVLRSEDYSFYSFPFGASGDQPVAADFDGDGKADPTVFRPSSGTWYSNLSGGGVSIVQFGSTGDQPVPADFDGDGKADQAIYRPSNGQWWAQKSGGGVLAVTFGLSTDRPVAADFTGDGKADVAFFRPSNGSWFVLRSEDASFYAFPFGAAGDIPAPGDYDGDGKTDPAVFRPLANTWYISGSTAGTMITGFGASNDIPVPSSVVP